MIAAPSARDLVISVHDLPSPPSVYLRLSELMDSGEWNAGDAAAILGADPALSARLLRLANSPFYGVPRQVSSIQAAVTLLGAAEIRSLVLATVVIERFQQVPEDVASAEQMRRRSLYCALAAARVGSLGGGSTLEHHEWFLAGLMFDLGSLVVCLKLPEAVREAVLRGDVPGEDGGPSIECAVTRSEQALVGRELLGQWRLPTPVVEAVGWSRAPLLAPEYRREAAVVHIASRLSGPLARGLTTTLGEMHIDRDVWALAGLAADTAPALPDQVREDYATLTGWLDDA